MKLQFHGFSWQFLMLMINIWSVRNNFYQKISRFVHLTQQQPYDQFPNLLSQALSIIGRPVNNNDVLSIEERHYYWRIYYCYHTILYYYGNSHQAQLGLLSVHRGRAHSTRASPPCKNNSLWQPLKLVLIILNLPIILAIYIYYNNI